MAEPSNLVPAPSGLREIHQRMKALAGVARLPLRSGQWRGSAGIVLGQGTGSSIDFQDQRPYVPGDDPRHINWQAYARTGSYTMKLFREEVSPRVDLLFDISPSMFLTESKAKRTWELFYFCLESALHLGATVRVQALGAKAAEVPLSRILAYDWNLEVATAGPLAEMLSRSGLRQGSLRIFLSDLLSPAPPEGVVPVLVAGKGKPIVLAPFCPEEQSPAWDGNIEFEECETGFRNRRRVEKSTLERYLKAYQIHFALWREQCARHHTPMARVSSEGDLLQAFRGEAFAAGCIEIG